MRKKTSVAFVAFASRKERTQRHGRCRRVVVQTTCRSALTPTIGVKSANGRSHLRVKYVTTGASVLPGLYTSL